MDELEQSHDDQRHGRKQRQAELRPLHDRRDSA